MYILYSKGTIGSLPGKHPNFLGKIKKTVNKTYLIIGPRKLFFCRSQVSSTQACLIIHSLAQKSSLTRMYFCSSRHGVELEECK